MTDQRTYAERDPITALLSLSLEAQNSSSKKDVQVAKMKAGKIRKRLYTKDYKYGNV